MARRGSDFAGSWYPAKASDCERSIEEFSRVGPPCPPGGLGGIVPHAGWLYSGAISCRVVKCLSTGFLPDTMIIFGRHLHPSSPNYLMKKGSWATPFGDLEIDEELGEKLSLEFAFRIETADRYEPDNTIEVQLPFIKYFFPNSKILPVGVPPNPASLKIGERVVELAESLGRKTMVLGSTDLTHYGSNYGFNPKGTGDRAVEWVKKENDKRLVDLILHMDPIGVIHESLRNHNACCAGAVASAVTAARRLGAERAEKLIYSTSYDIMPDTSFVGYAGVIFLS
ncbi:MAG: AmmeMemoRadiSam system protein B [Deltaproteobacteria bacterium]|nr:AmmeMemoRadiSam system protein B [Deltaproteobacteria bacterium]